MEIQDRLYNQILVDNPIIEELINTKPFQRLKEINQYGGVNFVFPDKYQVTRFQHSLGVYHVLKSLRASAETQINGLLHDVGHTAFSHMYDMALSTILEDNHEKIVGKVDGWNEIDDILKKNSLKLPDPSNFNLIKKPLPNIGADRFDYALRDYIFSTNKDTNIAIKSLEDISTDIDGMYFNTLEVAKNFADTGNKAMEYVIYNPILVVVYQSIIEMIRLGFKDSWLNDYDFLKTDKDVFAKMMQNKERIPEKYTKIFVHKYVVEETSKKDSDFTFVKLKSRYFDPLVLTNSGKKRVSDLSNDFKASLASSIETFEHAKTGIYYKVTFVK